MGWYLKLLSMDDTQYPERQSSEHFAALCQCASVSVMAHECGQPLQSSFQLKTAVQLNP